MILKSTNFLLSAWSFYFRWPRCKFEKFYSESILMGGLFQAVVFVIFFVILQILFNNALYNVFLAQFLLAALTGFFHEDGFADTADSLGVSKFDDSDSIREKISHAFKDPRLGTFGVSALCILWLLRYSFSIDSRMNYHYVAIAVIFSRQWAIMSGVLVARFFPAAMASKGSHQVGQINPKLAAGVISFLGILALLFVKSVGRVYLFKMCLILMVVLGVSVTGVYLLSRRSGGLNGDILGCLACFNELLILFAFLNAF